MKVKKAVIPVAGLGTRFLPATKTVPKELLPIVDIPAVQYVVQEAMEAGIAEVIFVTGRGKDSIEDHFDEAPELDQVLESRGQKAMRDTLRRVAEMVEIVSVRQKRPLGLGHAVLCARDLIGDEPFAVLLSDDLIDAELPCVQQLVEIFEERKESVLALRRVPRQDVNKYGIVGGKKITERLCEVTEMVEKPHPDEAPSQMAIIGRYILRPEIFSFLEKVSPGKGGEIQLTDAISQLARRQKVYGYEFEGAHYDIGDKFGFVQATVAYALKRPDLRERVEEYLRVLVGQRVGP
ncbi:MAG TPA: UTP--glucose-1-phosphate uridylyltransferase GalU [Candidatus Binatia bacterium]|jgi:UTP--glucose-1-phosphate uridylyltransferase|nr:UTP--glucose-1-phosphate uridylyltransferase GalU [Candidatus Binatia bacterium]